MTENKTPIDTWPPAYTLKRHARARHVKFKASIRDGLEIVVPVRFNQKYLPKILEDNRAWIEKRLQEIQLLSQAMPAETLPTEILLRAVNQTWRVSYIKTAQKKIKLMIRPDQEIVLMGDIDNQASCIKLLSAWVKTQAEHYLVDCLQQQSIKMQLPFKQVSIRKQKSRWGSCTSDKVINLNYKLIFMPPELMLHVLIHELCHTVQLNHSTKFWRLVAIFDPEWKQHSREIRRAEKWMPHWAA